MQQLNHHKIISRPLLILICTLVITILLGLPRLSMMLRLDSIGLIGFDTRDYIRRLAVTFMSSLLILSFNLYMEDIKLGPIKISFAKVIHLVLINLVLFAAIQSFIFFRFANRFGIVTGPSLGSFYYWNLAINATVTIVCILIAISYRSIKEKYLVKLENEGLQKETAQAKFAQLREQISPHFMFNSFSTLNGLIEEAPERAKMFLMNMSDVYRYVLKNERASTVCLDEELHFAKVYAAMIEERFGKAVQFKFSIPTDKLNFRVVPLSIQMLIENAVKHNYFNRSNPLYVKVNVIGEYLEVHNNLQKRELVEKNHSIGLYNLNQRYKYASKKEVIITQTKEDFRVQIPLLK
ncbi:MAG: histidine kinase [Bacteroidota bacterium]